jgi:hypothetical protein
MVQVNPQQLNDKIAHTQICVSLTAWVQYTLEHMLGIKEISESSGPENFGFFWLSE